MASGTTIGALMVQLLLDDDEFDLEKPRKAIEKFGKQLDDFASSVEDAFLKAGKVVATAVAGIATASAVVGANFESQMTKVGVIAGAVGEEFEALEGKARELGASTAYSATEAAGAMELLASAGLGVNEILTATADVLYLAGAGGTDLNTAAAALASTMAQFSLEAKESGRIADVLAKATAETQFRVDDLADALKYGGVAGAGFGWSLEQTVAALGMFRDLGLQGSLAGTALRSAMVGAATASQKNIDVLAKYGLTLADVSPDVHSFAEILKNVGEASMSTSDALIVFGVEAGAALNSLASSAAAGSNRYNELVATLEQATGTSSQMYGKMQDNVLGSFRELQSVVEEGLLTLFDSFSVPLQRLLDGLTEKLSVVVEYFRANSAGITSELERQVDAVLGWLTENQELLAVVFTEGARAVVDLMGVLGSLLPMLDQLAVMASSIFLAKKVLDFANALQTAVAGFKAIRAAIIALNVELTVSTGGLWAIVAAVGAVVAGLVMMAGAYSQTEQAAKKLRLEQQRSLKVSQQMTDQIVARYGDEIAASKAANEAKRVELAAAGKMTAARREELNLIRESTEAELAALVAQGKLISQGGELRTVTSLYEELEEDALIPVQRRFREMATDQERLTEQASQLEQQIAQWESRGEKQARLWATGALGFAGGIEEAKAQVMALREQAAELGAGIKTLEAANTDAQASLLETYAPNGPVGAGIDGLIDQTGELESSQEKAAREAAEAWERAFQKALEAAASAVEQQRDLLEDAQADEEEALRLKHERELRDLEKAREEALAEIVDSFAAQMIVESEFDQARADMEKRQAIEIRQFQWEQTKLEIEQRRAALEIRISDHARALEAVEGLERENMTRLERFDLEMADFFRENSSLTAEERARAEAAFAVQREEILEQEKQAALDAIEEERAARRDALRDALDATRQVLGAMRSVVESMVGGVQKASQTVRSFLQGLIDLADLTISKLTAVFAALTGGEVNLGALGFIAEALAAITSGEAGGATVGDVAASFVEEMAANAGLFLDAVIEGLPKVIGELLENIPELVQAVADALPIIIEQLVGFIPAIMAILAENVPIILQAVVASMPMVIDALAAAIPGLVQIIAENLPIIVQALVENLPTLISAITAAIPDLVQVFADNLPILIQAFVDAWPEIVDAIIASIPILIEAFAVALPILLDGLISQIPRLIDALMMALPEIVQVLADGLVQVIQAIPAIIDQILAALPDVITGLLDAVPQIIVAIFEAIPQIIDALIEHLPEIVQALLEGILSILVAIAENLPTLIAAFLELIPELITEIINMIPDIITAIIDAIPTIIFALIAGLPDIIAGIITLIPELTLAIIAALPQIITALVSGLITEFILQLPQIISQLVVALVEGLVTAFKELVEMIADWFRDLVPGDGTGTDGEDDRFLEDAWETVKGWFTRDDDSSYSGISYVPATMRGVTLHAGEAVLTADENQRRLFGGAGGAGQSNPAVPVISPQQGGLSNLEALFAVDGRIVDGVVIRANQNGKGNMVAMMKRKAGVKSGVKTRGRFKYWSS